MIGINCNNYQLRFKIIGKILIIGRIREREKVIVMAFINEGGRNNGCSIILLYFIVWIRFLSYTMQIGHSLFLTSPFLNFTINITFSHSSNDQIFSANSY